jgi:hypothetical protein
VLAIWNPGHMPSDEIRQRLWAKLEALREASTSKGKAPETYPRQHGVDGNDALLLAAQDFLDGSY